MRDRKRFAACAAVVLTAVMMQSAVVYAGENAFNIDMTDYSDDAWENVAVANDDTVETGIFIRSAASEKSSVVGYLYRGGAVTVLRKGAAWSEVQSGDVNGYIRNDCLVFGTDAKGLAEYYGTYSVEASWDDVNVFAWDDPAAPVVTVAGSGDTYPIVNNNGHWLEIQAGDTTAYVSEEDVTMVITLDSAVLKNEPEGRAARAQSTSGNTRVAPELSFAASASVTAVSEQVGATAQAGEGAHSDEGSQAGEGAHSDEGSLAGGAAQSDAASQAGEMAQAGEAAQTAVAALTGTAAQVGQAAREAAAAQAGDDWQEPVYEDGGLPDGEDAEYGDDYTESAYDGDTDAWQAPSDPGSFETWQTGAGENWQEETYDEYADDSDSWQPEQDIYELAPQDSGWDASGDSHEPGYDYDNGYGYDSNYDSGYGYDSSDTGYSYENSYDTGYGYDVSSAAGYNYENSYDTGYGYDGSSDTGYGYENSYDSGADYDNGYDYSYGTGFDSSYAYDASGMDDGYAYNQSGTSDISWIYDSTYTGQTDYDWNGWDQTWSQPDYSNGTWADGSGSGAFSEPASHYSDTQMNAGTSWQDDGSAYGDPSWAYTDGSANEDPSWPYTEDSGYGDSSWTYTFDGNDTDNGSGSQTDGNDSYSAGTGSGSQPGDNWYSWTDQHPASDDGGYSWDDDGTGEDDSWYYEEEEEFSEEDNWYYEDESEPSGGSGWYYEDDMAYGGAESWYYEEDDASSDEDPWSGNSSEAYDTQTGTGTGYPAENYEIELLAALIYCEAGNQPYEGQVAVGAVVMNRVASDLFPGTITEVIYQSGQFTPAFTGVLASALADGSGSGYMDAAYAALAGQDPTGGCLFFNTSHGSGVLIGAHWFY